MPSYEELLKKAKRQQQAKQSPLAVEPTQPIPTTEGIRHEVQQLSPELQQLLSPVGLTFKEAGAAAAPYVSAAGEAVAPYAEAVATPALGALETVGRGFGAASSLLTQPIYEALGKALSDKKTEKRFSGIGNAIKQVATAPGSVWRGEYKPGTQWRDILTMLSMGPEYSEDRSKIPEGYGSLMTNVLGLGLDVALDPIGGALAKYDELTDLGRALEKVNNYLDETGEAGKILPELKYSPVFKAQSGAKAAEAVAEGGGIVDRVINMASATGRNVGKAIGKAGRKMTEALPGASDDVMQAARQLEKAGISPDILGRELSRAEQARKGLRSFYSYAGRTLPSPVSEAIYRAGGEAGEKLGELTTKLGAKWNASEIPEEVADKEAYYKKLTKGEKGMYDMLSQRRHMMDYEQDQFARAISHLQSKAAKLAKETGVNADELIKKATMFERKSAKPQTAADRAAAELFSDFSDFMKGITENEREVGLFSPVFKHKSLNYFPRVPTEAGYEYLKNPHAIGRKLFDQYGAAARRLRNLDVHEANELMRQMSRETAIKTALANPKSKAEASKILREFMEQEKLSTKQAIRYLRKAAYNPTKRTSKKVIAAKPFAEKLVELGGGEVPKMFETDIISAITGRGKKAINRAVAYRLGLTDPSQYGGVKTREYVPGLLERELTTRGTKAVEPLMPRVEDSILAGQASLGPGDYDRLVKKAQKLEGLPGAKATAESIPVKLNSRRNIEATINRAVDTGEWSKLPSVGDIPKAKRQTYKEVLYNALEKPWKQIFQKADDALALGAEEYIPPGYAKVESKALDGWAFPKGIAEHLNKAFGKENKRKWWEQFASFMRAQALLGPAYHTRNMIGNAWNSALAVDNPANLIKGHAIASAVMWGDEKLPVVLGGKKYTTDKLLDAAKRLGIIGTSSYRKEGVEEGASAIYKVLGANQDLGSAIEDEAKFALFLTKLDEGQSISQAADTVHKFLFDYADLRKLPGLRWDDKKIRDKGAFFWTFTRKNAPLQLEMMLKRPQFLRSTLSAQRAMKNYIEDQKHVNADKDLSYASPWMKENLAFPINYDPKTKTYTTYMLGQQLPLADAELVLKPLYYALMTLHGKEEAQRALREMGGEAVSRLSPQWKAPLELLFGKDMYLDKELDMNTPEQFMGHTFTPEQGGAVTVYLLRHLRPLADIDRLNPGNILGTQTDRGIFGERRRTTDPSTFDRLMRYGGFGRPVKFEVLSAIDRAIMEAETKAKKAHGKARYYGNLRRLRGIDEPLKLESAYRTLERKAKQEARTTREYKRRRRKK